MGYYLEEHPNPNTAQYGWPRPKVSGVIGVHTTESGVVFAGPDAGAENTAGFIGRRSDHGSYHIMADWDTIVPLVRPTFAAWADTTNNVHALSVSGAMNAARWRDLTPARAGQIVRNMGIAAAMLVRDAIAHGVLDAPVPARRITAAEAIAGSKAGFYGHGETNPGTRYDPGTNFDWDLFLSSYAAAVGGQINYQSVEDDMPLSDADVERVALKSAETLLGWVVREKQPDGTEHTAALSWYLLSRKAATEELVRTIAQTTAQTILNAKLPNVLTGGETTLGLETSWAAANAHAVIDKSGAASLPEGLDADTIAKLVGEGIQKATDGLSITLIKQTGEASDG